MTILFGLFVITSLLYMAQPLSFFAATVISVVVATVYPAWYQLDKWESQDDYRILEADSILPKLDRTVEGRIRGRWASRWDEI